MTKIFLDTNILLYASEEESMKRDRAMALLAAGAVVSVQVLNEFIRVSTRKYKVPLDIALLALIPVRIACEVVPLTLEMHELAVSIMLQHKLQIFDANIVAAAELSGCDVLHTEDMNDGQRIGRVTIANPFKAA